jgi:hypothetical protein
MKTVRLTEAGLNKLVKRIIEDKGSEGLFMDYHSTSKASTGKEGMAKMEKIMDKLERMKSRFESSNFSFSKDDVLKLELIDGLLYGRDFDRLINTYKEKKSSSEESYNNNPSNFYNKKQSSSDVESQLLNGKLVWDGGLNLYNSKLPQLPDNLRINGDLDLRNSNIKYLPEDLLVNGNILLNKNKLDQFRKSGIPPSIRIKGIFDISKG